MAKFQQKGDVINYKNAGSTKIAYGDLVTIGTVVGVATEDIAAGATGGVKLSGVFNEVPAITTEAFTIGAIAYLNADGKATVTKGSLTVVIGMVVEAKATAGTTCTVRL